MDSQAFGCKHLFLSLSPLSSLFFPPLLLSLSLSLSPSDMRTVSCNFLFLSASRGPINLRHSWRNSPLPPITVPYPSCPPCPRHPLLHIARPPVTPQSGRVQLLVGVALSIVRRKNGPREQSEVINLSQPGRDGDNSICASRANRQRGSTRLELQFLPGVVTLWSSC